MEARGRMRMRLDYLHLTGPRLFADSLANHLACVVDDHARFELQSDSVVVTTRISPFGVP